MATLANGILSGSSDETISELRRRDRSIASPLADALLFWGSPVLALLLVAAVLLGVSLLPHAAAATAAGAFTATIAIITYAHLIAVVPRAYLNRDVLSVHSLRLTVVPVVLVAALLVSPSALAVASVVAVFWDVHHSGMQTFGLGRLYDMKAGNDPVALRRVDLLLNAALYIGPIAAGASMIVHVQSLGGLSRSGLAFLTTVPVWAGSAATWIRGGAIVAWIAVVGVAIVAYARAADRGYHLSAHKRVLLLTTASVSILAWGFAPPLVAFMAINLFHAVQYFGLVWIKEGGRMRTLLPAAAAHLTLPVFLGLTVAFGAAYLHFHDIGVQASGAWLAPFIACSLLHFWYDAFIWSVRKKLV